MYPQRIHRLEGSPNVLRYPLTRNQQWGRWLTSVQRGYMWMAGGGVKPDAAVSQTAEPGLGRNEKLTDFGGNVIKEVLA